MVAIVTPDTAVSHGYSTSAATTDEATSVNPASARTPIVCATVTDTPSSSASRARPCVPTR
jgi:hypothetical protein